MQSTAFKVWHNIRSDSFNIVLITQFVLVPNLSEICLASSHIDTHFQFYNNVILMVTYISTCSIKYQISSSSEVKFIEWQQNGYEACKPTQYSLSSWLQAYFMSRDIILTLIVFIPNIIRFNLHIFLYTTSLPFLRFWYRIYHAFANFIDVYFRKVLWLCDRRMQRIRIT